VGGKDKGSSENGREWKEKDQNGKEEKCIGNSP